MSATRPVYNPHMRHAEPDHGGTPRRLDAFPDRDQKHAPNCPDGHRDHCLRATRAIRAIDTRAETPNTGCNDTPRTALRELGVSLQPVFGVSARVSMARIARVARRQ